MYENLKAEIVRAGMSNSEMAAAVGLKYATMWRLLSGKQPFRLSQMTAIQRELEGRNDATYSLDYLFWDGDENGEGQSDQGAHDGSVRPD